MQQCRCASSWLCVSLGAPEDDQNHSYCAYRWVPQRKARITTTVPIAGCPRGWQKSNYRSTGRRDAAAALGRRRRRYRDCVLIFKLGAEAAQTQTACQSGADGCLGADCVPDLDAVAVRRGVLVDGC